MRVKFNQREIQAFLHGEKVTGMLRDVSRKLASNAGEGFISSVRHGGSRSRAYVLPNTDKARRETMRNHALERAIGKGLGD